MSIAFERASKTFLGFLQARGKALHTIKNYACDLQTLGDYSAKHHLDFQKLSLASLEAYHRALKSKGLRPNSCRRKLMTAKVFLRYLSGRMDVSTVGVEKLITPEKVEKPPKLVKREHVLKILQTQPNQDIGWRNRAIIGVLLDTGMLVTEALNLRQEDFSGNTIAVLGKRARSVQVNETTAKALQELRTRLSARTTSVKYFFYGYTKAGPNAEKLTARGVELLFKGWARVFKQPHLHPRTLRHLFVLEALSQGKSENEIMQILGVKTPYMFRVYRTMMKGLPKPRAPHTEQTSQPSSVDPLFSYRNE